MDAEYIWDLIFTTGHEKRSNFATGEAGRSTVEAPPCVLNFIQCKLNGPEKEVLTQF